VDVSGELLVVEAGARVGGRYRLDRELATGGMGTVWQGWDERAVAVKLLRLQPGLSAPAHDLAAARAMREARNMARLHHPCAVPVYDVLSDDGGPCLILQYVPSRDLHRVVREVGPLPPTEAARIGTQLAGALAAAHQVGIVHRDIKPANVLITGDGTAKITDFGISQAVDDVTLTATGMVTGTPSYLAPEVARGGSSSFASDVYSLGATLFMALEGGRRSEPTATQWRSCIESRLDTSSRPAGPVRSRR
jgi:serine/threonine protein kinase